MKHKLKEVFDQIQAEEALMDKTKEFLFQKTKGYEKGKPGNRRSFLYAAACLLLLLWGGYWLYFTSTVQISIEINPSIELGVNRFDRIISVNGYQEDGKELADSLNLQYMDYTEAVKQILENGTVKKLLSKDEVMEIGVIGPEGAQSSRILSNLEACAAEEKNARCYYASSEEVQGARQEGLSYGKYKAFLEIQALSPDITAEEVRGMTMREIRELIGRLSASRQEETGQQEKDECQPTGPGGGDGSGQINRNGQNR